MKPLESKNFEQVISEEGYTLVKFEASWCMPCKAFTPVFESIKEGEVTKKIEMYSFDIDQPDAGFIASKYYVQSVPQIVLFKNGKVDNVGYGLMPKEKLLKFLNK